MGNIEITRAGKIKFTCPTCGHECHVWIGCGCIEDRCHGFHAALSSADLCEHFTIEQDDSGFLIREM